MRHPVLAKVSPMATSDSAVRAVDGEPGPASAVVYPGAVVGAGGYMYGYMGAWYGCTLGVFLSNEA